MLEGWADAVWDIGIEFGTVGARRGEHHFEITTYRDESYDRTTRKPAVTYGDNPCSRTSGAATSRSTRWP